jgi:magnesium-transporting ATPase (P-type)
MTAESPNPLEPLAQLFRDLRSTSGGLSGREAARRLEVAGPNELARRGGRRWPGELAGQFTHPLALLLAVAAALAWASGAPKLAIAIAAESVPVTCYPGAPDGSVPLLQARDLVFSGTECTGGEARALVTATGMGTELGRIASLSQRVGRDESPLEHQVMRVARLIALVAVGAGIAFLPIGLAAGLSIDAAVSFAIGLLVANVPEGLLPTITLALAVGVREMARRGALVKRLSAVETLGSTSVICTDKTGTLTENRMRVTSVWTPAGGKEAEIALAGVRPRRSWHTSAVSRPRPESGLSPCWR